MQRMKMTQEIKYKGMNIVFLRYGCEHQGKDPLSQMGVGRHKFVLVNCPSPSCPPARGGGDFFPMSPRATQNQPRSDMVVKRIDFSGGNRVEPLFADSTRDFLEKFELSSKNI